MMDPRFGRARKFLIVDTVTRAIEVVDNQMNQNVAQGAGVQAAQNIVVKDVEAVITGHCGPKAFRVLTAGKVPVYTTSAETISMALAEFESGALRPAEGADVAGHWA